MDDKKKVVPRASVNQRLVESDEDSLPPNIAGDGSESSAKDKFLQHTQELRTKYADKAYELACLGVRFWIVIVTMDGICCFFWDTSIFSDKIIMAITAASTVNLLGAFLGVIRGLFPTEKKIILDSKGSLRGLISKLTDN